MKHRVLFTALVFALCASFMTGGALAMPALDVLETAVAVVEAAQAETPAPAEIPGEPTEATVSAEEQQGSLLAASGVCGDNALWSLSDSGTLSILGSGPMWDYYVTSMPWYDFRDSITAVVIGKGITEIGSFAFYNMPNICSVTMADTVTYIDESAFENCTALTKITFSKALTKVGEYAFSGCAALTELQLPAGVRTLERYAFKGAEGLTKLTLPEGLEVIGEYAFRGCCGLTQVSLPSTLTAVGTGAFESCSALERMDISNLAAWCAVKLSSVTSNPLYQGCSLYVSGSRVTDLSIPKGVTAIEPYTFAYMTELKTLTVPAGVTYIGANAFEKCTALCSVSLPEGLTAIRGSAFSGCAALTSVELPTTVTTLGNYTFSRCTALKRVSLNEGLSTIGEYTFWHCSALESITIPGSLETVSYRSFYECPALRTVVMEEGVKEIGKRAFYNGGLTELTLPASVTKIREEAFFGCIDLEELYLSDMTAFCAIDFKDKSSTPIYYADRLYVGGELQTALVIPEGVTFIEDYAFYSGDWITAVILPESLTEIGYAAFASCKALTDVYYRGSEEDWNGVSVSSSNSRLTDAAFHYHYTVEPDVNGDGRVGLPDLIRLMRYLVGAEKSIDTAAADVTGNGTVDLRDAVALLKRLAG